MRSGQRFGSGAGRRRLHASFVVPLLPLFIVVFAVGCTGRGVDRLKARELAEVREAFAANLAAIRARDLDAYLAGYLDSPEFVYLGPQGVAKGFASFAATRRARLDFPDSLEAGTPELTWVAPGVVHAAYPFAARQGAVSGAGWSERVFVRTADGWKIAVTSVIPVGDGGG
jgi:ketosteroid isomerase-like protein